MAGEFSDEIIKKGLRNELIYSIAGLIVGVGCILGGLYLSVGGATGSVSWTANIGNFESKLVDASPGVVLMVIGAAIVWVTKYSVKLQRGGSTS